MPRETVLVPTCGRGHFPIQPVDRRQLRFPAVLSHRRILPREVAAIELINSVIRKFTRNRKQYLNEESALKLVYLAIHEASKKWTLPIPKWREALNHFAIIFEDRLPAQARN